MFTATHHVNEENQSIESLIADLVGDHAPTRHEARLSRVAIGQPAVLQLIAFLSNPNEMARWEAVRTMGEIGGPEVSPALVRVLENDEDEGIRWLAAKGLIGLGCEGLPPLLQALVHHSDSVWLREGAHHVLRALAEHDLKKVVSPVLKALDDIEPAIEVPLVAQAALNALVEAVGQGDDRRVCALKALAILAGRGAEVPARVGMEAQ
jgi:HEAT repeat protein